MKRVIIGLAVGFVMALGAWADDASAQQQAKKRPFEGYARRPSVSPYMNLLNNNTGQSTTNYQSLVKPQLDQQNYNNRTSAAVNKLQRDASQRSVATKDGGNAKLRSTGHRATFGEYSHYYPGLK